MSDSSCQFVTLGQAMYHFTYGVTSGNHDVEDFIVKDNRICDRQCERHPVHRHVQHD